MDPSNPTNLIAYGPLANCTLQLCSIEDSVYHYRPRPSANATFLALFGVSMLIHIAQGLRRRTWFFSTAMVLGCICEMVGYGGRLMLYQNPFSFAGFLMQISKSALLL